MKSIPWTLIFRNTQYRAWFLGMEKDLRTIETGKLADLVILNSNPLDDIHNTNDIQSVMKGGILLTE